MVDLIIPFIIVTLIAVIIIQAVERYFYSSHMMVEQSKLIAAVMSKNMGEYNAAIRIEKDKKPVDEIESDEIEVSQADDETFDKLINQK